MQYKSITKEEWDRTLEQLLSSHDVFAPVSNEFGQDYELIKSTGISGITYNKPKPVTSLKNFFLPVKENVTAERAAEKSRIIIGIPNCDIEGLSLLDEIYLDKDFMDPFYRRRRENTLLIASDCFGIQEHCHCLSYGIKPWSVSIADLAVISLDGRIIFRIISGKGEDFISTITASNVPEDNIISAVEKEHSVTEGLLAETNKGLPDYKKTGKIVAEAKKEIWEKYSSKCVSCGACATICPTCTCFLLIDKPGFEKVKQLDACQYPGFERVAGGEDGLYELHNRFRNRYMCKYVWKPQKFRPVACTGCGRCIEACIGKINKNELFMELA
jgi:sulfhydrogenase subunit beta (sulfur reductase)